MADLDEFSEFERPKRHKLEHPKGWEPGVTWTGNEGTIVVQAEAEPDPAIWAHLIADWDLDPTRTEVIPGSVQIRAWDSNVGNGDVRRLKYYRATLRPKEKRDDKVREDIDQLCASVMKRKPSKVDAPLGNRAFLVLASDWQAGKGEGGGSAAMTERVLLAIDRSVERLKELKKLGRPASAVYLIGLGDLVEGCSQFYAMQEWQTDLDRREQGRLVRRLLLKAVDAYVDAGYPVVLGAVPGNHGENRNATGRAYTTWTDNDDLATFEQVGEILAANPDRYANVNIPIGAISDDLTMTLDIAGVPCGFAHGHQFPRSGGAQTKIEGWWKGQALGRQAIADAELLFAGHLHHFVTSEATGRTLFQAPAMDGGSKWFTQTTGSSSPAGMLTMMIGSAYPRGWGDLEII